MKGSAINYRTTIAKRILAVSLLVGIVFNALFYGRPLGFSVPLFIGALVIGLVWLGRSKGLRPLQQNRWLLLPLSVTAIFVAVRGNPFLTFLNLAAILCLLALVAHFSTRGRLIDLSLPGYAAILARVPWRALSAPAPLVSSSFSGQELSRGRRTAVTVSRGLVLAIPLFLFFTLLLFSADMVFAAQVGDFLQTDILATIVEWTWRNILVIGIAWIVAGGLSYALLRDDAPGTPDTDRFSDNLRRQLTLGTAESAIILGMVNVLFVYFAWIQLAYFFTGRASQVAGLPPGFTYAEYARRGFFQLLVVATLSIVVIVTLEWLTARPDRRRRLLQRSLNSLMMILVAIILASASSRLRLYEQAYGYTELRLYVRVFMNWLGLLLLGLLILQWWGPGRIVAPRGGRVSGLLGVTLFLFSFGFLLTLNVINPDALIVRHNLVHYLATGRLDAYYLSSLSDDAVPQLVAAVPELEEGALDYLCSTLSYRRTRLASDPRSRQWPAWHLSAIGAHRALNQEPWVKSCPPSTYDATLWSP